MKIPRSRPWLISVLACLLLCSCDHHKTTTQNYGRFVMTKVMSFNSYFGLSSLVYQKMCRDDGELCIKCVNSNGKEPFCDLQIYDDSDTDFLLYTDRRSLIHLVNSASGAEVECKNSEFISKHVLEGVYPYWLDGDRLIISSVDDIGSPYDPYTGNYIGYEVQLGAKPCVVQRVWFYPVNGYSSSPDRVSPDRKGVVWTAYNEKKCLLRWFYGDYVMHEKEINCAHRGFRKYWVGDHPELSDKNS
jgi:hypothetical protein